MTMQHRLGLGAALFLLLWIAFAAVGVKIHHACRDAERNDLNWVDISAYDAEGYLSHYVNIDTLFMLKVRHPALKPISLPYYLVGSNLASRKDPEVGKLGVICTAGAVGAATCLLLWLVMARLGVALLPRLAAMVLWLSFGHVWILGALAESYPLAQLLLIATVYLLACGIRNWRWYLALALASGGVTITNFVKPLTAWALGAPSPDELKTYLSRRSLLSSAKFAGLSLVLLALIFLGYGLFRWYVVIGCGFSAGIKGVWAETFGYVDTGFSLTRLWYCWQSFACEPFALHGSVIARPVLTGGYNSVLPHLLVTVLLALAGYSAWRNWRLPAVRAILAMIAFDLGLHLIVGWGIREGQLYCGHWFWAVPILMALLPRKIAAITFSLALGFALWNVSVLL